MPREVLLVDDEEVFSSLTRSQLLRRGFEVVVAHSGEEALEKTSVRLPDVILLDVLMPGMGGIEFLKRIKADARTASIPVVVCSLTLRDRAEIQPLLALGAADCVAKPCRPDELSAKLIALIKEP